LWSRRHRVNFTSPSDPRQQHERLQSAACLNFRKSSELSVLCVALFKTRPSSEFECCTLRSCVALHRQHYALFVVHACTPSSVAENIN